MNQYYDITIRLWTGQEKFVPKILAPDENNARQYIHNMYGESTEIIDVCKAYEDENERMAG